MAWNGVPEATVTSWGLNVPLGSIQLGQSVDTVIRVAVPAGMTAEMVNSSLHFKAAGSVGGGAIVVTGTDYAPAGPADGARAEQDVSRHNLISQHKIHA